MTANRNRIRPGQHYVECEECGAFARGGSRRTVLAHAPGCSQAPPPTPEEPAEDDLQA